MAEEDLEPNVGPFSWHIEAFKELSTCRSGMSLTPIPFTAIAEYCRIYSIDDMEEFLYLMRAMDTALIEASEKKDSANGK